MILTSECHITFVGSLNQYWQWWSLGQACVWYDWELPSGSFSFEEVGTFGHNPAWQRMRTEFGFLPEELREYEDELLVACTDRWDFTKRTKVPTTSRYVAHEHFIYEGRHRRSTIDLEEFYHESGIILGAAGFCSECQELYYYVRPR